MDSFDLVIIGSGPGGYVCAIRAAQLGLTTALVEKHSTLGGTCLNVGCIPSKALLESSDLFAAARHRFADHGIALSGVSLELGQMMARKSRIVVELVDGVAALMKKNKVTVINGRGVVTAPGRVTVTGEGRTPLDVETAEESVGSESGTLGFFQHKQVHQIYYSDDHQKRAVRPRLDITQNTSSIGFKMGGQMKQWISAVDPEGHWVEVTSEGPNLMPVLVAAIALFVLGKSQPPAVGTISEPAETKRGSWIKDAGLYIALQCLAAVGNYAFTIYACPMGEMYQTFEASANDTELQNDLRGTVIETRIDDPLVYDTGQAQKVAQRELWILQAQRRRVNFSKTAHLQEDAGDTLQVPHPYTGAPIKLFVTNLTRTMTIPGSSGSGEYKDSIEGWVL